jgi:hypothetical protein
MRTILRFTLFLPLLLLSTFVLLVCMGLDYVTGMDVYGVDNLKETIKDIWRGK